MKKNILKIAAVAVLAFAIYFGWNTYQKYSKVGELIANLVRAGEAIGEGLTSSPIVTQELYSADSTIKVGVYRFLIAGDGAFEASSYQVSLIDTSIVYPKSGNILTDVESRPVVQWVSTDSILVKEDSSLDQNYDFVKKLMDITILIKE